MICRLRAGVLGIRSVPGDVAYEVDLRGETAILGAALDEDGRRLAVVLDRARDSGQGSVGRSLVLIDLQTGTWHVAHEGFVSDPVWFPRQARLAFSNGCSICILDASTGSSEEVYRFAREPQAPNDICLRPDGRGLSFLKSVGDDRRIGVVDLDTGEGRVHSVSCFSYCWWDDEAILYVLGSGLKLLDVGSGKSHTLLRDLTALNTAGALTTLDDRWLRGVRMEGVWQEFLEVHCVGDRVYVGAAMGWPVTRRTLLPFIRRTDYNSVRGVLSMTRDLTDLRLLLEGSPRPLGIVPINRGRTLAIGVSSRCAEGWLKQDWVFVGEGAESIPEGFGPLPRASATVRGSVCVGAHPAAE